jgi:hypothetical protein
LRLSPKASVGESEFLVIDSPVGHTPATHTPDLAADHQ